MEEYEKEETYCERQRILGRIMILATMDKFHYPINEINSYAMCRLALLYKEGRTRNITEDNARNLLLRAETMGESWATKILEKLFNNID